MGNLDGVNHQAKAVGLKKTTKAHAVAPQVKLDVSKERASHVVDKSSINAHSEPSPSNAEIMARVERIKADLDAEVGPSKTPSFPRLAEAEAAFSRHDSDAFMRVLVPDALAMPSSAKVMELAKYSFDKGMEASFWNQSRYFETAQSLMNMAIAKADTVSELDDISSLAKRMSNSVPFMNRFSSTVEFLDIAQIAVDKSREIVLGRR